MDIYDDLDNYEDVHALEELRAENKELKVKLEEHSAAMEKIKKEYDTLETAFKQLERNYSSLLMTARGELHRKAQMITQLNKDIEVMVLDAYKSGKNIRRKLNRSVNSPGRKKQDKPLKGNKTKQDNVKQKNVDIKLERQDPPVKSTKETGPDSGTSKNNKSSKAADVPLELSSNKKSNVAEQKTDVNERLQKIARGIKGRRKSVPALSKPIDTFSSGDELEGNHATKGTRTENERRSKFPIERPSNRDESPKHYDSSSRDISKSRISRQHDSSSYRSRDKCEVSSKSRKQYSPERRQKRPLRELQDEYPKQRENVDAYPKQHRDLPDDYARKHRELSDDYAKKHWEDPVGYPKQRTEQPDDYPKHREYLDDYPKHRENLDEYSKQRRDYPDDYLKKRKDHPDDYFKPRSDHPDDYLKPRSDHPDDYLKKRKDRPDDYPKQRKDHPDDYLKQRKDHPDDYLKQRKDHPDDYLKPRSDHPDDYLKPRSDHSDDYQKQRKDHPDDYLKPRSDHPDDYQKQRKDHPDDYLKPRSDHPDDYQKQRKDYPDDYLKQCKDHPDDYTKKYREHSDDYAKQHREHPIDYPKLHRDHPDDYAKKYKEQPDDYLQQNREHQGDFHKHERERYQERSLESPTTQSYNRRQRSKSIHQYDLDRHPQELEKDRYYRDDKYSAQYRSKDYDEPQAKRPRTESYGNPEAHSMDDKRHYRVRESVGARTSDLSPHEYDMLRFTCQSPDSLPIEGVIANPTKEIRATASSPLDDPRVTSKRYVIRKENGRETLSTALGRNIEIIPLNKAVWDIKPVDVPVALVCKPPDYSDIYVNIEIPVTHLNASMESGEVFGTDDELHETCSKSKEIQYNTQDPKKSKQVPEDISNQPVNIETVSKQNIAKYRIPKMNKTTQSKMDVPIIELGEIPQHKSVEPKPKKKGAAEDAVPKELLKQKQQDNKHKDYLDSNKNGSKVVNHKKSRSRDRGEHQSTLTKMAIVADDLELSDDNSDHIDIRKNNISEREQNICGISMNENRRNESVNNVENKTFISAQAHNTDIKNTVDTTGLNDVAEEEKTRESDSAKKQKGKKKKSKSKEISKDSVESTPNPIPVPEKKSKPKKDSTPKEKFCDLFGDSSSLMTPEDLGIPSYLPISEDAQDAVDLKINQIIDSAPLVDKNEIPGEMLPQNKVTIQETTGHDDIPKADIQKSSADFLDKEVIEPNKKMACSKRNEEVIETNQLPSPIVYENLNPESDLNDPNVVKTVIISTGKQPELACENKTEIAKPDTVVKGDIIQNTKDMNVLPATMEFKKDILKALATSTPHKEFTAVIPLDADAAKSDTICDPCVSQAVATITNVEPVVNQTEESTVESNDAPDVRIFVKRRRKVVKRPPMT